MTAKQKAAQVARDLKHARMARQHLKGWTLTAIQEARRAGIPVSLGLAMLEQESGGRNVFGHDPVKNHPELRGKQVTKKRYLTYKEARNRGAGMQGVGPLQLTWWELQDEADRRGGCWRGRINIRVGFEKLAALIKLYGKHDGIRRYNGSGPAANRYTLEVQRKADVWHKRLSA